LKSFKCSHEIDEQGFKRFKTVAWSHKHDDGNREGLRVLLEFDVLIGGQHRIELGGSLSQECSVTQTRPTHLGDGPDIMTSQ
jgi:hypothetical protein